MENHYNTYHLSRYSFNGNSLNLLGSYTLNEIGQASSQLLVNGIMFVGGYYIESSIKYTLIAAFTMTGGTKWALRSI